VAAEHYLARYIIRKREVFARVRFLRARAFVSALEDYGRLHQANCKWFDTECGEFYSGALKDWKRVDALLEDFSHKTHFIVGWYLQDRFKREIELPKPSIYWDKSTEAPRIGFELPDEVIAFMEQDEKIRKQFANALKVIYRYEGEFSISFDVPF
jgi:hypothetical protein